MSGDGLLQPRVVSAAGFGGTDELLRLGRAAVPLQAHLWSLQLYWLRNMFMLRETVRFG